MREWVLKDRDTTWIETSLNDEHDNYEEQRSNYLANGFIVLSESEAIELIDANNTKKYVTEFIETTEENYWNMLEVLPPIRFKNVGGATIFMMSEYLTGTITSVYVNYKDRYFTANKKDNISYAGVVMMIEEQFFSKE